MRASAANAVAQKLDSGPPLKTAVIVPAYNEAGRIFPVLKAITEASLVDEVIVVADGCTDSTADEARAFAARMERDAGGPEYCIPLRVFDMEHNIGKGGALTYGAHRTEADVVVFLDADLIGLQPAQVDALIEPMLDRDVGRRADMTLGLFGAARGGVVGWWLGFCHRKVAAITGQRAIRRDVFLAVPGLTESRFGVETAITRYVRHEWKLNVQEVALDGVTHPIKEEKIGIWRGVGYRIAMYGEIMTYLTFDILRNRASMRHRRESSQMRQRFSNHKT
ncbi:MAG TPA: glycosyltransferase family 2 protein [Abditibacteriaceae bacterium]|nr:glycosyltransferase family 2 protein [Abditibacteriaceae bacterium]